MTEHALPGVLDGIRVVEFAQNAAIPHCGRLLAGLGADVVKVEPPDGDAMRRLAALADMESRAYALINPGKRSIAIDLGSEDARPVIDALFAWADVALVAFKLPDLARYGIDWEHARTVNPRLVHSDPHRTGARRARRGVRRVRRPRARPQRRWFHHESFRSHRSSADPTRGK